MLGVSGPAPAIVEQFDMSQESRPIRRFVHRALVAGLAASTLVVGMVWVTSDRVNYHRPDLDSWWRIGVRKAWFHLAFRTQMRSIAAIRRGLQVLYSRLA